MHAIPPEVLIEVDHLRLDEPIFTFDFRDFRAITVGDQPLDLVVDEGDISR